MHSHHTLASIDADNDPARKCLTSFFHKRWVAHGRSTDDDAGNTLAEPAFDGCHVAHTPTELYTHRGTLKNTINRFSIHRLTGKRAIKIDDVQIIKTLRFKSQRLRGGIAVKHRGPRHVALLQAHGLAFLEIDSGKQNHGDHVRKFAIRASPMRWLFSGWNCVPTMVSRPTMAVTGPP